MKKKNQCKFQSYMILNITFNAIPVGPTGLSEVWSSDGTLEIFFLFVNGHWKPWNNDVKSNS